MTIAKGLSLSKYTHSIELVRLFLQLSKGEFLGWEYTTERELLRDALSKEGGFSSKIKHLPDLSFLKDDKEIVIELELSRKTVGRMQKILNGFRENLKISKVIYWTIPENESYLRRLTEGDELFEVRLWLSRS
jgi:hypothetical protein